METAVLDEDSEEQEPEVLLRERLVELIVTFPGKLPNVRIEESQRFFESIRFLCEPISFEIVAKVDTLRIQFAVAEIDVSTVISQFKARFSECRISRREGYLESTWDSADSDHAVIVQFGLAREALFSLANGPDAYGALFGALTNLESGEIAILQAIVQAANKPWAESLRRSVLGFDNKPVFVNMPEFSSEVHRKVSAPLFAVTFRLAVKAQTFERTSTILRSVGGALAAYSSLEGNGLVPLENSEYPFRDHENDLLTRQSRRTGMILNTAELAALAHIPGTSVVAPKLVSLERRTRAIPESLIGNGGVLLGVNRHEDVEEEVRLGPEQRVRNTYIIGTPGTGKSTLLLQMVKQDLDSDQGFAVIDPHGDLIEAILRIVPEDRIGDVILLDVADEHWSVGLNILSAHSDTEKSVLASDLVSVFERLSTSWGDQMGIVLHKALLAFMENPRGGTLLDLEKFLIDSDFRKEFLANVADQELVYYWTKAFPLLSGNRSVGPILTRLQTFLSSKSLRYIVAQRDNRVDFSDVMNGGKIFLAKLSQGLVGKENARLLGSLLMAKFQQAAMRRQAVEEAERRHFWIYADEFHDYISPSIAEILSGARKYKVGLVLAHQEVQQLDRIPEVASAVRSAYAQICFRVTDRDAKALSSAFTSFESSDLQRLGTGEAIARFERSDFDFNLHVPEYSEDGEDQSLRRARVIQQSRDSYATARETVESEIQKHFSRNQPAKSVVREEELPPPEMEPPSDSVSEPTARSVPVEERFVAPSPLPDTKPEPTADPMPAFVRGRGGNEHTAVQIRIKEAAEQLGFVARMEEGALEGRKWIDLLLERGESRIAVEISVTRTVDGELGNISKCLEADFQSIAVICSAKGKLQKIKAAVDSAFNAEQASRVRFFDTEAFLAHLREMPKTTVPKNKDSASTVRGYKVKRSVSDRSRENSLKTEAALIQTLAKAMKK